MSIESTNLLRVWVKTRWCTIWCCWTTILILSSVVNNILACRPTLFYKDKHWWCCGNNEMHCWLLSSDSNEVVPHDHYHGLVMIIVQSQCIRLRFVLYPFLFLALSITSFSKHLTWRSYTSLLTLFASYFPSKHWDPHKAQTKNIAWC